MMARTAGFRIVRIQTERPGLGASGRAAFDPRPVGKHTIVADEDKRRRFATFKRPPSEITYLSYSRDYDRVFHTYGC